jgi:hypothetical protein
MRTLVPKASVLPRHDVTLRLPAKRPAKRRAGDRHHPQYLYGYVRGANCPNDALSERVPQHRYVIMRTEFRREAANPSGGADRSYAAQGFNSLMTIPLTVWGSLFTKKTERTALPTKAAARSQPRMRRP